jgi:hypothetical protein
MSGWELLAAAGLAAANQVSQGIASNTMARHAASISENYAAAARDQAAYDEARAREQAQRALGARRAGYANAGVTLEGTPIDVMGDAATDAEMDALSLRRRGDLESWGRLNDAAGQRMRGGAAARSGAFGAGSSLLSGLSHVL